MPSNSHKKSSRRAKILSQFSIFSRKKPLLDLLEIQRKSFFDLLKHGIPHELAKIDIFRETAKNSIFTRELELTLNPETYKFISPNCTPKQAILKGKTYASKLYVQATVIIRAGNQEKNLNTLRVSALPDVSPYTAHTTITTCTTENGNGDKVERTDISSLPSSMVRMVKRSTSSISALPKAFSSSKALPALPFPMRTIEDGNQRACSASKALPALPSLPSTMACEAEMVRIEDGNAGNAFEAEQAIPPKVLRSTRECIEDGNEEGVAYTSKRGKKDLSAKLIDTIKNITFEKSKYKVQQTTLPPYASSKSFLPSLMVLPLMLRSIRQHHSVWQVTERGFKSMRLEGGNNSNGGITLPNLQPIQHNQLDKDVYTKWIKTKFSYLPHVFPNQIQINSFGISSPIYLRRIGDLGAKGEYKRIQKRGVTKGSIFPCVETLASQNNVSEHNTFFSKNTLLALRTVINSQEVYSLKKYNEKTRIIITHPHTKGDMVERRLKDGIDNIPLYVFPPFEKNYICQNILNALILIKKSQRNFLPSILKISNNLFARNYALKPFCANSWSPTWFLVPAPTPIRKTDKHLVLNPFLTKEKKIQSNFVNSLFPYWRTWSFSIGLRKCFRPISTTFGLQSSTDGTASPSASHTALQHVSPYALPSQHYHFRKLEGNGSNTFGIPSKMVRSNNDNKVRRTIYAFPYVSHTSFRGVLPSDCEASLSVVPVCWQSGTSGKKQLFGVNEQKMVSSVEEFKLKKNDVQIFRPWIFLGELPLMTKRGHFILNGSPRVIVNQIARCPGIYFQEKRRGVGFEQEIRVSADLIPQRGPWLRIQSDWEGRFWARLKQEGRVKYATLYEAFQEFEKEYNAPLVSLLATGSSPFLKSEIIAFQERKTKEDRQKNALIRLFKNSTRYSLGKIGRFRINQRVHLSPLNESIRQKHLFNLSSLHPLLITSLKKLILSSFPQEKSEIDQYTEVTSAHNYATPAILFPTKSIHTVSEEGNREIQNINFCSLSPQHYLIRTIFDGQKQGGKEMKKRYSKSHTFASNRSTLPHTSIPKVASPAYHLLTSFLSSKMAYHHIKGDTIFDGKKLKPKGNAGMSEVCNPLSTYMPSQHYLCVPSKMVTLATFGAQATLSHLRKPSEMVMMSKPSLMVRSKMVSRGGLKEDKENLSAKLIDTRKDVTSEGNKHKKWYGFSFFPSLPSSYPPRDTIFDVPQYVRSKMVYDNDAIRLSNISKNKETENSSPKGTNYLLMAQDIDAIHTCLECLLEGQGFTDDIDHLKNRFIRTSGKLLQQQFELGLHRLNEVIKPLLGNLLQSHLTFLKESSDLSGSKDGAFTTSQSKANMLPPPQTRFNESSGINTTSTLPLHPMSLSEDPHTKGVAISALPMRTIEDDNDGNDNTTSPLRMHKKMVKKNTIKDSNKADKRKVKNTNVNAGIIAPFRWLRTSKPVNGAFREFFGSNPLSQYMDQTNPLAEITHKRRLSSMGPGGIKRETAGMEVRGIHPTHYGRVCPIETPEGKNAGLVNSPTVYGRVGNYGFLETPLYQVIESQVQTNKWAFFSAQQEEEEKSSLATCDTGLMPFNFLAHTPIPVQTANNPLAHFQQVERSRVGYRALSPVQTISIATALIPFLEHDDANRALMGSNMQRQAIPLLLPERPIVGTGFEPLALVESGQALQATKLGCISHVNAKNIIIHSIHSTRKAFPQSVLRNTIDNTFINQIKNKGSINSHFDFRHVNPYAAQIIMRTSFGGYIKDGNHTFYASPYATRTIKNSDQRCDLMLTSFVGYNKDDVAVHTALQPKSGNKMVMHKRACYLRYAGNTKGVLEDMRSTIFGEIPPLEDQPTKGDTVKEGITFGNSEMVKRRLKDGKMDIINKLMKNANGINKNHQKWYASTSSNKVDQSNEILSISKTIPHKTPIKSHLYSSRNFFLLKPFKQTLQLYQRSNQETCLNQRPLVQEGHWVQKGDFLADCSASGLGDLALGKNVTVAYMPWEGYNFEDAIVISDRLISEDVYTSLHIERYEIKVNKNSQGKEKITNRIPGTSRFLKHLDNFGIAQISSWVQPGDILVGKVVELKRPLSPYERLAWELASRLSPASPEREKWLNKVWLEDISLRLPPGVCGRVVNSQIVSSEWSEKEQVAYPLEVHIYLAVKRKIQIGDKLAGRHGNKGIVSTILPQQDMPYLNDGTSIDMILNPLGVPSRMNLGQIFECLLGLAGSQLGCNFKITPFDEIAGGEASRSLVFLKLYQCRLLYKQQWLFTPTFPGKSKLFDGRTGEPFENWVTVGQAYMLKLIHMVDHKIHARSTGPYSLFTRQPVRGRSRRGGQRLGEMEVWAVEGFGAAYTLQEFLTIKSDDLKARTALQRGFYKQNNVTFGKIPKIHISPGNPEAFKVLVSELQALCLHIQM